MLEARRTIQDLLAAVFFTSYFSCMDMIEDMGDGVYKIHELPTKDTPLILTFGKFC